MIVPEWSILVTTVFLALFLYLALGIIYWILTKEEDPRGPVFFLILIPTLLAWFGATIFLSNTVGEGRVKELVSDARSSYDLSDDPDRLIGLLEHESAIVQEAAAKAIGDYRDQRFVASLLSTLERDPKGAVGYAIIRDLASYPDDDAVVDALVEEVASRSNLRHAAHGALETIMGVAPSLSSQVKHVPALVDNLDRTEVSLAKQSADVLVWIGEPAFRSTLAALAEVGSRSAAARALGLMKNEQAVDSLLRYLNDSASNREVAEALWQIGWVPETDREVILNLVATGSHQELNQRWSVTKRVLLGEAKSGDSVAVQNAVGAFVRLGREEVIPDLVGALSTTGTKEIAEVYLNSGHPGLEAAAGQWASRNGFTVSRGFGESAGDWGSGR